jgi:hypothetical protein
MKTPALLSMIALAAFLPLGVQAQHTDSAPYHSPDARNVSKKLTSLSGKVGSDGKTLMTDKDNRIWMVSNPEALSGVDGGHVKVKAFVDTAQSQIRIVSVSAIAEEPTGVRLHDAAFRR